MSARRTIAQRTLTLFSTSCLRIPPSTPHSRFTNPYIPSVLSCRRYLSSFTDSSVPTDSSPTSAASFPNTNTANSTSSPVDSATPPADSRWSHILDPTNPPKLTLAHYALLNKIPNTRSDASTTSQPPPTSATPGLDHAIDSLNRMLHTIGQDDARVRQDIIAMQQQISEPAGRSAGQAAEAEEEGLSFFTPTTKLKCRFCTLRRLRHTNPHYTIAYTNVALLHQFINLRGMLYGRRLTGNCGRHQRQIAHAVKRARVMGLLSFTSNWRLPDGWAEVEGGGGGLGEGEVEGEVVERVVESQELSFLEELEESRVDEEDEDADDDHKAHNRR